MQLILLLLLYCAYCFLIVFIFAPLIIAVGTASTNMGLLDSFAFMAILLTLIAIFMFVYGFKKIVMESLKEKIKDDDF